MDGTEGRRGEERAGERAEAIIEVETGNQMEIERNREWKAGATDGDGRGGPTCR
uniref:Uncharacterized protein n=1 Tax=Arundo donax TaxID=35708 RepID=A0A0A9H7V1_ARUDO